MSTIECFMILVIPDQYQLQSIWRQIYIVQDNLVMKWQGFISNGYNLKKLSHLYEQQC